MNIMVCTSVALTNSIIKNTRNVQFYCFVQRKSPLLWISQVVTRPNPLKKDITHGQDYISEVIKSTAFLKLSTLNSFINSCVNSLAKQ